jgi:flagellar motor switch/type III secretory pathway protein FliN
LLEEQSTCTKLCGTEQISKIMSAQAQPAPSTEMIALQGDVAAPGKHPTEVFPWLKCTISLEIPVVRFTVHDLLEMRVGTILETSSKATSDVPVRVNGKLIGWTEFEVIGNTLAVRITELA